MKMPHGENERLNEDRVARSVAVERTYVHEVYDAIAQDLTRSKDPLKATVHRFLEELDPGSLVADIGCGDGRYVSVNSSVHTIGADRSEVQAQITRSCQRECLVGDNLDLPFRSEVFDAVTSISVVHHLATTGRRVKALRELARILRVGGKILITVHALDDDSKFCSRDVLLAWYRSPRCRIAAGKPSLANGQQGEDDDYEDDNDYDDSISLPSSDEDEEVFPVQRVRPLRMVSDSTQQESVFEGKPDERMWRSLDASPRRDIPADCTRNGLEPAIPAYSCYSFVKNALRRLRSSDSSCTSSHSVQVNLATKQRSYSTDSALPSSPDVFFKDNIPYDRQYYYAEGDINHIELRNLDEDDEYPLDYPAESSKSPSNIKSNASMPMSDSKSKLVRSFSDFFKRIPKLWNSMESSSSCNDLTGASIARDNSIHFSQIYTPYPQYNSIVRSQTTATCTFKFEAFPRLEKVEELDYFVDLDTVLESLDENKEIIGRYNQRGTQKQNEEATSLTSLDIENGNVLQRSERTDDCIVERCEMLQSKNNQMDSAADNSVIELNDNTELFEQVPNCDNSNTLNHMLNGLHNNSLIDVSCYNLLLNEQESSFCEKQECDAYAKAVKRGMTEANEIDDVISRIKHVRVNEWTSSPERSTDRQQTWHMVYSKTAGPFYDTDDEDTDGEAMLSSYYSMPELYKLSDFHEEYCVQKQRTPKKLFLENMKCEVYSNFCKFLPQENDNLCQYEIGTISNNENILYTNPSSFMEVLDNRKLTVIPNDTDTLYNRNTPLSEEVEDYDQTLNLICRTDPDSKSFVKFNSLLARLSEENDDDELTTDLKHKNENTGECLHELPHPITKESLVSPVISEEACNEPKIMNVTFTPRLSQTTTKSKLDNDFDAVMLRDLHEETDESTYFCSSRCHCSIELIADSDNRNPSDAEGHKYTVNTERNICIAADHPLSCVACSSQVHDEERLTSPDSSSSRLDKSLSRYCRRFNPLISERGVLVSGGDLECLDCSRSAFSSQVQRNQYSVSDGLAVERERSGSFGCNAHCGCKTMPNAYNERTNSRSRKVLKCSSQESPKINDCLNIGKRLGISGTATSSCTSSLHTEEKLGVRDSRGSFENDNGAHFCIGLSQVAGKNASHNDVKRSESSQINILCNSVLEQTSLAKDLGKQITSSDESSADCSPLNSSCVHVHQAERIDSSCCTKNANDYIECLSEKCNACDSPVLENDKPKERENPSDETEPTTTFDVVSEETSENFRNCVGDCLLNQHAKTNFFLDGNYEHLPSKATGFSYLTIGGEKFISGSRVNGNECAAISCGSGKSTKRDANEEISQENEENVHKSCEAITCVGLKCELDYRSASYSGVVTKCSSSEHLELSDSTSFLEKDSSTAGAEFEILRKTNGPGCSIQDYTEVESLASCLDKKLDNINEKALVLFSKETCRNNSNAVSNNSGRKTPKERSPVIDTCTGKRNDVKETNNEKSHAYRDEIMSNGSEVNSSGGQLTSHNKLENKHPVVHGITGSRNSQKTLHSSINSSSLEKECNINMCQSLDFKYTGSRSISSENEPLSCCDKSSSILPPTDEETGNIVDHLYGQVGDEHSTLSAHRYYHLFQERELEELIENYIQELHVLSTSYRGSSCCIVAEKVRVWTI